MDLPSKQTFDKYVQMGLLKSASFDGKTVYCYNEFCQYSQLWNQVTRQARGIVFSEDGELLQRCVPKFFNMGEREGVADYQTIPNESVRANPTTFAYIQLDTTSIRGGWPLLALSIACQ